ncbi:hypothetical protein HKCCE3408_11625 [Rhodobacterales bacterium HKCCE3408]|nr:hypothetical protein [Rhodobacterales bacterium HKCCE3408]
MNSARDIYQANLDAVSAALLAGDTDAMTRHLALPNLMATEDAEIVISSVEELDLVMTDFRDQLLARGVVRYHRICRQARFVPGLWDMITGIHDTWCTTRDGTPCVDRYESHMTLIRIGGDWKAARVESAIRNTDLAVLSPDIAAAQAIAHAAAGTSRRR